VEGFELTLEELGLLFTPLVAVAAFMEHMCLVVESNLRRGVLLAISVRQRQSIEYRMGPPRRHHCGRVQRDLRRHQAA
jgi:hypothetical protein